MVLEDSLRAFKMVIFRSILCLIHRTFYVDVKKVNFETPITNKSVEIKPVPYVAYIFENYKVFTEQTIFSNKLLKQRNNNLIK